MSKYIINDNDVIELLDFLIYQGMMNKDYMEASKAEYLAEKLCIMCKRDYMEYVELVKQDRKIL